MATMDEIYATCERCGRTVPLVVVDSEDEELTLTEQSAVEAYMRNGTSGSIRSRTRTSIAALTASKSLTGIAGFGLAIPSSPITPPPTTDGPKRARRRVSCRGETDVAWPVFTNVPRRWDASPDSAGRYPPVLSRCLHPGQQHGRRRPSSSSSCVRRMRRSRVVSCLASSTQQMNSFRAKDVMSFHASNATGFAISALRRSGGSSCTTPPGTRWLLA